MAKKNDNNRQKKSSPLNIGKPSAASIPGYTGGTIDRKSASSNAALDQFYYGQTNPTNTSRYGTKATPGYQDIDGVTFSPEALAAAKANNSPFVQGADYNKWAAGMATTSPIDRGFGTTSAADSTTNAKKSYKDINSIKGGLKIGGNNILGAQEARKISRATGRPQDKVIAKALESGFGIGGNLVNQSNKAFRPSMNPLAIDPLAEMRRVKTDRTQTFNGSYQLDGQPTPLVQARGGRANPLSIGGGGGGRKGKGKRGRNGGMTAQETAAPASASQQPMDYQPMTPQEMAADNTSDFGMMSGGGAAAAGAAGLRRSKSRLRQLGIYGRGTSLLSRGLQYGNTLNR